MVPAAQRSAAVDLAGLHQLKTLRQQSTKAELIERPVEKFGAAERGGQALREAQAAKPGAAGRGVRALQSAPAAKLVAATS